MSDFKGRLGGMKKSWSGSKKKYDTMFSGEKVPEGVYVAQIQKCAIKESKASGNLMIARQHLILEGEYKGTILFDNMQLETEMGPVFIRRWIEMVGYEAPEDVEELPEILDAIAQEAPVCKVRVKHSGDFVNVNVSEMLDAGDLDEMGIETGGSMEETAEEASNVELTPEEEVKPEPAKKAIAKKKPKKKPAQKKEHSIVDVEEIRGFCSSQDIPFEDSDEIEDLKERISEYTFSRNELDEKEVDILIFLGLEDDIED